MLATGEKISSTPYLGFLRHQLHQRPWHRHLQAKNIPMSCRRIMAVGDARGRHWRVVVVCHYIIACCVGVVRMVFCSARAGLHKRCVYVTRVAVRQ